MDFRNYIKNKINENDTIIEFGPLNRPLFRKEEFENIFYADIRSTDEVKQLYSGNDYMQKTGIKLDINSIVDIDYKIDGTYKNTFKDKKFNIAYLSHVIEHIPNIINFFIEINEVLEKDGLLVLIYPDKRYCFDHFRNEVSFRDAYATYKYGIKENARLAFDFAYNVVHENSEYAFWHDENIIRTISRVNLEEGEKYYEEILKGNNDEDKIEDVHFWPFSDYGFLEFIYEMQRANLLNFDIEDYKPTQENTQEFLIILKKVKNPNIEKTINYLKKYGKSINQIEINNLHTKLLEKDEIIKNLSQELKEKDENNKQLLNQIDLINNSKSMKVTKPLRIIMSKLRKEK